MQNLIFCWYYIKHALIFYTNWHLWTTVFKASIWYAGASIKGIYPTVVLFLLPHCAFDCIQSNQSWVSLSYDGMKQHASTFCFFLNTRNVGDCTILRLSVFEMWGHFPQQVRSRDRQCSSILVFRLWSKIIQVDGGSRCPAANLVTWNVSFPSRLCSRISVLSHVKSTSSLW